MGASRRAENKLPSLRVHALHRRLAGSGIQALSVGQAHAGLQLHDSRPSGSHDYTLHSTCVYLSDACLVVKSSSCKVLARLPVSSVEVSEVTDTVNGDVVLMVQTNLAKDAQERCVWLFAVYFEIMEPLRRRAALHLALGALVAEGAMCANGSQGCLEIVGDKPIGMGSFADVWRAKAGHAAEQDNTDLDGSSGLHEVAAKLFKQDTKPAGDCSALVISKVVRREVDLLTAAQGHPNIVRFYDILWLGRTGVPEGGSDRSSHVAPCWCLTMEFCAGGDIRSAVRYRTLQEIEAKEMMKDVLRGLAHIHARGVLHRDVKPENIMLRSNGTSVLADFGLSCWKSDDERRMSICGSPGFIPPEVLLNQGWQERSDVFSAGVLLYYALSGTRPFQGHDIADTLKRTVKARLPSSASKSIGNVSSGCKTFLLTMLSKSVDGRPAAEVALRTAWLLDEKSLGTPEEIPPMPLNQGRFLWKSSIDTLSGRRPQSPTTVSTVAKPRWLPSLLPSCSKLSSVVPQCRQEDFAQHMPATFDAVTCQSGFDGEAPRVPRPAVASPGQTWYALQAGSLFSYSSKTPSAVSQPQSTRSLRFWPFSSGKVTCQPHCASESPSVPESALIPQNQPFCLGPQRFDIDEMLLEQNQSGEADRELVAAKASTSAKMGRERGLLWSGLSSLKSK